MYRFLLYLHIFGAVLFFLSHGATALAMFRVRDHHHPEAVRALMGLRVTQLWGFGIGFLMMGLSAIAMGIMNGLWGRFWMWGSTVIFVVIWGTMGTWGRGYFDAIEMALDPEGEKSKRAKKPETRSLDEVIASGRHWLLAWIGIGGTAVILWLMMYKPF